MKIITILLFSLTLTAFARKAPAPTPSPVAESAAVSEKCSSPFKEEKVSGFNGFCCKTTLTFVMKPEQKCPSGYTFSEKEKQKGATYYYCCEHSSVQ